ncbi:hypothetical protein [Mesorhizobium sp. Pch-S]|uniref:hypothetical protein n=1 Tax=Mesorhizobium sp. Pch-S TaxID=2082387 RepID=UPI00101204DA|nr:hypothetical protein [Mesorhizobium sp. Pch-S]QAZ46147.1 hypothetical protein C1M53_27685 [Mesorhizobium sp. Pch-S]
MSYPARLEQLLDEGRIAIRGLILYKFGNAWMGVWTGNYELVYEGVTYVPNQLITAEPPDGAMGMEATEFVVTMPARSDFGITPDKLAEIESQDYKGRPCQLREAYFDPDTRELLHVEELAFGYVDYITHVTEGGEMRLEGHVISGALDNHRDGYRSASHEDQQLISEGDRGFEYATVIKTEKFAIEL